MKLRKIPMRTCVVTKEKCEKKDLLRIVKTKEGDFFVDPSGKANGRGCYLKKSEEVLKKCKSNKILNKVFESDVPESIYDEILKNI